MKKTSPEASFTAMQQEALRLDATARDATSHSILLRAVVYPNQGRRADILHAVNINETSRNLQSAQSLLGATLKRLITVGNMKLETVQQKIDRSTVDVVMVHAIHESYR